MDENEQKIISDTISDLTNHLQIDGTFDFSITEDTIDVILDTNDMGLVIGYHGEVLESFQFILSLILTKKLNKFVRVSVEAGDYKKNREEYLRNLAIRTKEKVLEEGREQSLPSLKPWERRIIHLFLQEDQDVISESIGEGRERILVVKPRS